jgi:hypothetical protein
MGQEGMAKRSVRVLLFTSNKSPVRGEEAADLEAILAITSHPYAIA